MIRLENLLDKLDGSGSDIEWKAIGILREEYGSVLPKYLLLRYKKASKAGVRSSCVYHSVRYARVSSYAVKLGKLAIHDRSKVVRYRGCMLLAYSLNVGVLPLLREKLEVSSDEMREDVLAAIDAIDSQNHNYFVDRDHTGKISLNIG